MKSIKNGLENWFEKLINKVKLDNNKILKIEIFFFKV